MFKKVLIADDLGSINRGLESTILNLGVAYVSQVQYCDDAYLQIKSAINKDAPYDLLITDLSFKTDHRQQKYASGEDLIGVLSKEHPELKVIVYSVEDRIQKVRRMFENYHLDAYVCKGRNGLKELTKAIGLSLQNERFLSQQVEKAMLQKVDYEITDYHIHLIKLLSQGLSIEEISFQFKRKNISPSGTSSIEKKLNRLREQFRANNNAHLISNVKDLGLI